MAVVHTTLKRELERTGIRLSVDEYQEVMIEALRQLPTTILSENPAQELTEVERDALIRGGASFDELSPDEPDPRVSGATTFTALLVSSYSVEDVAKMLNVDRSRVRQRLGERSLFGVKLRGGWRIPRFQFEGCHLIPGIEQVIAAMPTNMDLVGWHNWFTLPDPDLEMNDIAVSPSEWLRNGGAPGIIAKMAADFEYGL